MLEMTGLEQLAVLHGSELCPELREYFQQHSIPTFSHPVQNSWQFGLGGLWEAQRWMKRFPSATYIIWAHHCESHRWLQLALALKRRQVLLVERTVPATPKEATNSRTRGAIKRFVGRRATAVVICGYSQVENYKSWFDVPRHKLLIVPNSRDVSAISARVKELRRDKTALRAKLGLPNALTVLYLARMDPAKDHSTLIRAMGTEGGGEAAAHLALVGTGEMETDLRRLANEVAPGRVTFAGQQADPLPWLAAADVFAFPSLVEGLPGALIEAMSAGLPCVVTDIPGNRELIHHEQTGLLVPIREPRMLAQAIHRLLFQPEESERLAGAGYRLALERYDEKVERQGWLELFGRLERDKISL